MAAQASGLSQSTISRIWGALGLQPQRTDSFKLSTDPQIVEKVRSGTSSRAISTRQTTRSCVAWTRRRRFRRWPAASRCSRCRPGQVERRTHDYRRHGTTLFAALDFATPEVIGRLERRHGSQEFLRFRKQVEREVPAALDVHLILDSYGTHKTQAVLRWFVRHPRFHIHSPDLLVLVGPRRALVLAPYRKPAAPRRLPPHGRTGTHDRTVPRSSQRGPKALRPDEDGGRDPLDPRGHVDELLIQDTGFLGLYAATNSALGSQTAAVSANSDFAPEARAGSAEANLRGH